MMLLSCPWLLDSTLLECSLERGDAIGAYFLEGLKGLQRKFEVIKEVRGRGMLLAIAFYPHKDISADWAFHKLMENHFLVGYYPAGNILRFDPSLTIEKDDIGRLLECLDSLLGIASQQQE